MSNPFEHYMSGLPPELVALLGKQQDDAESSRSSYSDAPNAEVRYYLRPGGSDDNDGLTEETALKSWTTLVSKLDRFAPDLRQTLDITGCDVVHEEPFSFPEIFGGTKLGEQLYNNSDNFQELQFKAVNIYAEPQKELDITISSVAQDATTSRQTLTVDEVLVDSAHVGKFVLGANNFDCGVIVSNTASEIVIAATNTSWETPVGIYVTGATLTFGAGNNDFSRLPFTINAYSTMSISGVKIRSADNGVPQSLRVTAHDFFYLTLCDVDSFIISPGGSAVTIDYCYFTDYFGHEGTAMGLRSSFLNGVNWQSHGEASGQTFIIGCTFEGMVFGDGNAESVYSFEMEDCNIDNSPGVGISKISPLRCRVVNTRIDNSTSHGISLDGPGHLRMQNVVGSGNGGYGLFMSNGAMAQDVGVNTLTGTSGDVSLGATGTILWSASPATDVLEAIPHFCRIYI